jgi:hypothetical protein
MVRRPNPGRLCDWLGSYVDDYKGKFLPRAPTRQLYSRYVKALTSTLDIMEDVGMEIQREVRVSVIKKDVQSYGIISGANLRVCRD